MFPRILLACCLLLSCVCSYDIAHGQSVSKTTLPNHKGQVTGRVVDSAKGDALEATVIVTNKSGSQVATATAKKDGNFSLVLPGYGEYTFTILYVGYSKHTQLVSWKRGEVAELGVIQLNGQPEELNEVVVKSKKPLIQSKPDKVVYNASADISNAAGSAADVLAKAPMITVDAEGAVKMRGNANIKVLLNGLPSGMFARNLSEALKMIPANTIESIEVITSPSAKYEAEGAGGVINIITKKLRGSNGNLNLNLGNLEQSGNGAINITRGKWDISLSGQANNRKRHRITDLIRQTVDGDNVTGSLHQVSDLDRHNRSASGDFTTTYTIDSSQKLSANASLWKGSWPVIANQYTSYTDAQTNSQYNQVSDQKEQDRWWEFSLNYKKTFARAGQELEVAGSHSDWKNSASYINNQYDMTGKNYFREQSPNNGTGHNWRIQADYTHPLTKSGKSKLETGFRADRTKDFNEYSVRNNRDNPGSDVLQEDSSRGNSLHYYQNVVAGYVSMVVEAKGGWTIRPGIRYERTRLGGDFTNNTQPGFASEFENWVPNLLIAKKLNERHDVKFNYNERINRPDIWDLNPYVNASDPRNINYGNPALRPELTRTLEAGHSYKAGGAFSITSSVYYSFNSNAVESLTTVDSAGVSYTTSQNVASNKRLGVNVSSSFRITRNWNVNTGGDYYHVWYASKALAVKNDGNFYSVNLNSSYTLPRNYTLQLSGNYNNGYVTLQGRGSAYLNYGFSARKEVLNKKAGITLRVNNIFQKTLNQWSYTRFSNFNSSTYNMFYNRSFTVTFNWQFGAYRKVEEGGGEGAGGSRS
ncbi:TonB-dependent receptor [Filimonas lacunae]|nr:TonB-dependent receptor [Filimonas lacunae]